MGNNIVSLNTIVLNGSRIDLESDTGQRFVTDAVRAGEGLISDSDLRDEYGRHAAL